MKNIMEKSDKEIACARFEEMLEKAIHAFNDENDLEVLKIVGKVFGELICTSVLSHALVQGLTLEETKQMLRRGMSALEQDSLGLLEKIFNSTYFYQLSTTQATDETQGPN